MALDSLNSITIDVADQLLTAVVPAVQEDIRSRFVEITLIRNGEPLDIPAGAYGMIGIRRPDGTYCLYDETEDETPAVTISDNVVTVYLSQEALAVAGRMYTSVSLYSADGTVRLTAFHFMIAVEETAVPSGAVPEPYINILQGLVEDAVDAANRAEQAAAQVGNPVGYDPQTPTSTEQAQARANIGIVSASTSAEGIVQLYDGIDSNSTTLAATAHAVKLAAESGVVPVLVSKSAVSALPTTITDASVTSTMVLIHSGLSSPAAQDGDWTVTTADGSATVSGTINGTTDITLILSEVE